MAETNTILEDAAAASTLNAGSGPDAALIAICEAITEADAAFQAAAGDLHIDDRAGKAAAQLRAARWHGLIDQMIATPATTLEGMRGKARVVARAHQLRDDPQGEGPLLSLLADLGATRPAD